MFQIKVANIIEVFVSRIILEVAHCVQPRVYRRLKVF